MTLRTINSKLSSLIFGTNNLDIDAPRIDMATIRWHLESNTAATGSRSDSADGGSGAFHASQTIEAV